MWLQWIDGAETLTVTNPATGEVVGTVPSLGASETRQAIKKAAEVQGAWAARTAKDRAEVLRRWFELMTEHSEALTRLMTTEQGKPWPRPGARSPTRPALLNGCRRSQTHLWAHHPSAQNRCSDCRDSTAGRCRGGHHALELSASHDYPQGRTGMAAGCSVVIKPSELTPFSALAMMVLAEEAGVPPD